MKLKNEKISTYVLWSCMTISIVVFLFALWNNIINPSIEGISASSGILIQWTYILLGIAFVVSCFFTCKRIIDILLKQSKYALKILLPIIVLVFLLLITYIFGSGASLNMPQYDGIENTYFWLKVADMCLYSIYFLIGLTVLVITGGIIWSYIIKN